MPETTSVLRVGLLAPVPDLDPRGGRDFVGATILAQLYETPFDPPETPDGRSRPVLFAEPLASENGGCVLSARVRPGRRFSDGTPLTAELLAQALGRADRLADQAAIEARDGRVVFRLARPAPSFDLTLTYRYCEVALETGGGVVGTGPFRLAPDSTPERMRLVRNPEYPGRAGIDEVRFVTYRPDADGQPSALLRAIDAGEVDFTNALSREHIGGLKGVRKWLEPGSATAILYFNTERPALAEVSVRRALALAIDRTEAARISYHNPLAFTATGLLPPMLGSWRDGIAPDLKRAAALLAAAGEARPRRLTMLVIYGPRPYLPQPRPVAEHLAARLAALGIEVEIRQAQSIEHYFREAARGDYDLALSGWVPDTPDPADFLETILSPASIPTSDHPILMDGNLARWRSPAAAAALERFRREPNEPNKAAVLELVTREMPVLPLMYGPTIYVYSPRVQGFKPSPLGIPRFAELSLVESM
ncbi:MAG TPA: ABC transporter substrate-binding protein [Thermoanaerobaculia bacterium]|nr:ABC transporter substrate-binding protein [Thermoanaerobaculia bacterium]